MLDMLLIGAESIGVNGYPITFLVGYIGFSFIFLFWRLANADFVPSIILFVRTRLFCVAFAGSS